MADIEKVINGLEHCIRDGDCRGCLYFKEILDSKIICPCREDALTLLKKHEAVEPIKLIEDNEWTVCGFCKNHLISKWAFCPYCGKQVKWK